MKKALVPLLIAALLLAGCGQPRNLTVKGETKKYPTYGLVNSTTSWSPNVCYEISVGNIIWSVILIETVVISIYFIGFDLWNPKRAKIDDKDECGFEEKKIGVVQ